VALLDTFCDRILIPSDTWAYVEPAAGEIWCFRGIMCAGDGSVSGMIRLYSAGRTSTTSFCQPYFGIGEGDNYYGCIQDVHIPIQSPSAIAIYNHAAASVYHGYSGWKLEAVGGIGEPRDAVTQVPAGTAIYVDVAPGEVWMVTSIGATGNGTDSGWVRASVVGELPCAWLLDMNRGIGEGGLLISTHNRTRWILPDGWRLIIRNDYTTARDLHRVLVRVA